MPDVQSQLSDNPQNVHKWGTTILALADYSATVPEAFFSATDGLPIALPTGYKNMGYITTDGIKNSYDVSSDDTTMLQDIDAVRSDVTSRSHTFQVSFGETNGWTKALAYGLPVSDWPDDPTAAFVYDDSGADFPFYRAFTLSQDGTGDSAVYRVEFAYRIKVSDIGDRTLNRTDVEEIDRTFTIYKDPAVNKYYTEAQSAAAGVVSGS